VRDLALTVLGPSPPVLGSAPSVRDLPPLVPHH
jgi:hypothetical protein